MMALLTRSQDFLLSNFLKSFENRLKKENKEGRYYTAMPPNQTLLTYKSPLEVLSGRTTQCGLKFYKMAFESPKNPKDFTRLPLFRLKYVQLNLNETDLLFRYLIEPSFEMTLVQYF